MTSTALRAAAGALAVASIAGLVTGCVRPAPPAPVEIRETPPPWAAPRDAVGYIERSGLRQVRLDATDHQHIITVRVSVDGTDVALPAYIGIDRVRAVQAPVHTHDSSGQVWLEGEGTDAVTLRSFFTVWGVRFDGRCLGAACGKVEVIADGRPVTDVVGLRLVDVQREVTVRAVS